MLMQSTKIAVLLEDCVPDVIEAAKSMHAFDLGRQMFVVLMLGMRQTASPADCAWSVAKLMNSR